MTCSTNLNIVPEGTPVNNQYDWSWLLYGGVTLGALYIGYEKYKPQIDKFISGITTQKTITKKKR